MTQTTTAISAPPHPLDSLSADEIRRAAAIVREARGSKATYMVSSMMLKEPRRDIMMSYLGWTPSKVARIDREALVILLDKPSGRVHELTVNLTMGAISRWDKVPEGQQPTIQTEEFFEAEKAIVNDPRVIEQCRLSGVTDMTKVHADPWGGGHKGRRLSLAILYLKTSPDDNLYAHPFDFNVLYDFSQKKVLDVIVAKRRNSKYARARVPLENHQYLPEQIGYERLRKDIKPIHITQPEGVSFTVHGHEVDWQKWRFRVSFNYREGLVLHNISYADGNKRRPILYRIALSEMVVPYGNPYEPYNEKMAFDVGEYGMGMMSNSLELGCDCVGQIHYMDATLCNGQGEPILIPNAICIHEEDAGLLLKHTDFRTGRAHAVRSRRLVLSHIVTAANYDYGLYYYFYQDGTIQYEVKATGELNTHVLAKDEKAAPYGTSVVPGVDGQHHQHFFCMRIDPMVDGPFNSVAEVDVVASDLPVGHKDNAVGNAFYPVPRVFDNTTDAMSVANGERNRFWRILNENCEHPWAKEPVGFRLTGQGTPSFLPKPGSVVYERARFATKTLWVTRYDPDQIFPAGMNCYRSNPDDHLGIPQWLKETKNVRNKDIVCWFNFGLTHVVRVEDFPIMPVETCGITLKPENFFMGNPAVDVPGSNKHSTQSAYAPCCRL
ncbi:copper amine oxidase [Dichotomocladium elegans]|nr:copper amine oxidase [Dichotomocladium elegans]